MTDKPCPSCGRCPTCGRGGYTWVPYVPRPWHPYQPYWYGAAIAPIYSTGTTTQNVPGISINPTSKEKPDG